MDSPKLPYSLSASSSTPFASSAVKPHRKKVLSRNCILIIIAISSILLLLLTLLIYATVSKSSHNHRNSTPQSPTSKDNPPPETPLPPPPIAQIRLACNATRFPDHCVASLSKPGQVPPDPKPVQIIHSAISVSYENLKTGQSKIKSILDSSADNKNRTNIAKICLEILSYAQHRTESTDVAVTSGQIKDARAWMSAALAYQFDCWSGLKTVNDTKQVVETVTFFEGLVNLTGNALSMMLSFDSFGDDVVSWIRPATERDGFWEKAGPSLGSGTTGTTKANLGVPSGLTEDVTVCGTGCTHKTVQEAVNAAPDTNGTVKFVIRIREGVYEETVRVPFEKKNVVFIGDGMGKTVITGSLNVGQPGMTTFESATVGVLGDGFMARDLTIENTAGADAHQAVAFRSDSDFSVLENCEFLGNQDTVYAHSLRQLYKQCRIEGNVDFIFGNSAAVFQDCDILIASKHSKVEQGANNAITAHGRIDAAQSTGFVFWNCSIKGTEEYMKEYQANPKGHKNFLGRPWKEFSRTVFVNCNLESLISPGGWMPWNGDFGLKTLYYGEYNNTGPGSVRSSRVPWSSEIPEKHVDVYSVANFIQADEWASTTA
ncbi:PREDICTED: probable pectinesterase/pectinesterase inhibitor 64 [Camelina sativa]|uniref:Probable pectinesterase/pectinesterase inhibitor 64 n=1 Tax=Camelina sativa TaxID=90675 RepID=A0ABM0UQ46_CAMSA|nr:PREDICTED: probable pectinesterase/pectinesterase inhibitor 64 [Camelina sativa]